ncbi:serine hydrolase domain-containing protein [Halotalea alkalilenta]|uniref:Beta-lactamase-related domain-containing protein n=1 Tax=Halotalea alkalilenta TaxID=376489 RepID=A0A172YI59_9GAMM|nr:serine hydrolase domain-containing protein [Halotalea alkalilenta]ANF58822.1 hypothetical protein A5892_16260 [Halotalea alkalilenta]
MLDWNAAQRLVEARCAVWETGAQPGGAIALFDASGVRASAAGGLSDLGRDERFSLDSRVRFASLTKHLFAVLLLRHGNGRVALTDSLGKHLPSLRGAVAQVAVGRALDMSSGLPDLRETLSLLDLRIESVTEAPALLDFISGLERLNFTAGSEVSYSNTGYRLVEAALAGQELPFAELLQRHIALPLGVRFDAPEHWDEPLPGLAPGYWRSDDGWRHSFAGLHLSASGSAVGSLAALCRWLGELLAERGPWAGMLAELGAPRKLADGTPSDYGLGIARLRLGRHTLFGHGGSHPGYKAHFLLAPERGVGAAVVANREDAPAFELALETLATLLGEALPIRSAPFTDGLYVDAAGGPEWLEIRRSVASHLGTGVALHQGRDGAAVSLSAHLPMALRQRGEEVAGRLCGRERRWRPARIATGGCEVLEGEWTLPQWNAGFSIDAGTLLAGIGPVRRDARLTALGGNRWLAERRDGPWAQRFGLSLDPDGRLSLRSHRSRVLRFVRRG